MKRARLSSGLEAQRVVIDVGGTKVTTTVTTIKRSTYLAGMVDLAAWEDDPQYTAEIFLDRDPEIFAMVLRLMRQAPHVGGLVPYDPQMCASIIAEADFLGFDGLLEHVKQQAYYNSREPTQDYPKRPEVRRLVGEATDDYYRRRGPILKAWQAEIKAITKKFKKKNEAYAVERFDQVYGSIGDALSSGVLPKYFLEPKPLVPPPSKKIIQLVPTDATTWLLTGDSKDGYLTVGNGEDGDDTMPMKDLIEQRVGAVHRVACHALVEDQNGHRWMEAMIHLTAHDAEFLRKNDASEYSLEETTGGIGRRTMLASDWFEAVVVKEFSLSWCSKEDYWTHLVVAEEPPEQHGFGFYQQEHAEEDSGEESD